MRPRGLRDTIAAKDYPLRRQGSRSVNRIRGLRDAMAAEDITGRSVPGTHAQRLAEISWLERESERLERETGVLEASMQRINNRREGISERRNFLLALVRESLGINSQGSSAEVAGGRIERASTTSAPGFATVNLEY